MDGHRRLRPLWLLDFDGVLNGPRAGRAPTTAFPEAHGTRYRVRYAPELVLRIRALQEKARVELRWSSSWAACPSDLNSLLGLPGIPPAFEPPPEPVVDTGSFGRLKVQAALSPARAGRRVVWTDDDAIPATGAEHDELEAARALLIVPKTRRCLCPGRHGQDRGLRGLRSVLNAPDRFLVDDESEGRPVASSSPGLARTSTGRRARAQPRRGWLLLNPPPPNAG